MSIYYFAYGSNLSHRQMKERCPESVPIDSADLPGFRLHFLGYSSRWKGGCACIIKDENGFLTGGIYQTTESDLKRLDFYEGVPDKYNREQVRLNINGKQTTAVTYTIPESAYSHPSEKYLETILEGCADFDFIPGALSDTLITHEYPIEYLFVYGKLKSNAEAHGLISRFCENIQFAVLPHYSLNHKDGLYHIVHEKGKQCDGELIKIKNMAKVLAITDHYERFYHKNQNRSLYLRMPVRVQTGDNTSVIAWAYTAGNYFSECLNYRND